MHAEQDTLDQGIGVVVRIHAQQSPGPGLPATSEGAGDPPVAAAPSQAHLTLDLDPEPQDPAQAYFLLLSRARRIPLAYQELFGHLLFGGRDMAGRFGRIVLPAPIVLGG